VAISALSKECIMTGKSEKMVGIESSIASGESYLSSLSDRIQKVRAYKPLTDNGRKAQTEAFQRLTAEIAKSQNILSDLRELLEVATINYLSGEDSEMAEGQMPVLEQGDMPAS
jgi:hypothetical protein